MTRVELAEHRADGLARYRLTPQTGQTHQLRVHMTALGVPLLGDPLYPVVADPVPPGDFRRPLQLVARELEFTDPVTGATHRLRSARTPGAWTAYAQWAGDGTGRPVPPDPGPLCASGESRLSGRATRSETAARRSGARPVPAP